jgi:hypothetical protein
MEKDTSRFELDIKSLSESNTESHQEMKPIAKCLLENGYSEDYKPGFNVWYNGPFVLSKISKEFIKTDFIWVCNKIASEMNDDPCIDNLRFCEGTEGDDDYKKAVSDGCCGFHDVRLTNPQSGNSFLFGYNFGH